MPPDQLAVVVCMSDCSFWACLIVFGHWLSAALCLRLLNAERPTSVRAFMLMLGGGLVQANNQIFRHEAENEHDGPESSAIEAQAFQNVEANDPAEPRRAP